MKYLYHAKIRLWGVGLKVKNTFQNYAMKWD